MFQEHPNGETKSWIISASPMNQTYSLVPERHHWIDFGLARRAGTKQAISATIVSSTAVATKVNGSLARTPKSMLLRLSGISRQHVGADRDQAPRRSRSKVIPCRKIIVSIRPRLAPSAMRIPISMRAPRDGISQHSVETDRSELLG